MPGCTWTYISGYLPDEALSDAGDIDGGAKVEVRREGGHRNPSSLFIVRRRAVMDRNLRKLREGRNVSSRMLGLKLVINLSTGSRSRRTPFGLIKKMKDIFRGSRAGVSRGLGGMLYMLLIAVALITRWTTGSFKSIVNGGIRNSSLKIGDLGGSSVSRRVVTSSLEEGMDLGATGSRGQHMLNASRKSHGVGGHILRRSAGVDGLIGLGD